MSSVSAASALLYPHGRFRARALLAIVRHHWFVRLRWLFFLTALVLWTADRFRSPGFERPRALAACIGLLSVINLLWWLVGRQLLGELYRGKSDSVPGGLRRVVIFVNAQMVADLLLLTAILRFTGGIENPMAIFYLFHMVIAALLLRPVNAALQGCWAMILYGGLGLGECFGWIAPHHPFLPSTVEWDLHAGLPYVMTAIGTLGAGLFGVLFFTLQISSRLDDQERELREANQALSDSQAAIRELQDRRSRFMQTAAHQLKSPLTGIQMLAGLVRDDIIPPDKVKGIISRIVDRCKDAIVQVTELLTLARLEDATPTRHRSAETAVPEVVQRVARRYEDMALAKRQTFRVSTHNCEGVQARVDERDFEDCVANLLDNAIKYTPEEGEVSVTVTCDSGHVFVTVADTGMGIAEDSVNDIFDPFRRGNLALAAKIPGSGLGLAIVREVVEQALGSVDVQSTVGKGSEFRLTFPRHNGRPSPPVVRKIQAATLKNPRPPES